MKMISKNVAELILLSVTVLISQLFLGVAQSESLNSEVSGIKFTIINRRNITGHWTTEVKLKHSEDDDGPYEVDVEQLTSDGCDGKNSVDVIATVTGPPSERWSHAQPPADYTYYPGAGYYKLHSTLATWDEGRKTCEREGAHLAIINSVVESNVLKTIVGTVSKTYSIGFHDRFVEGEYITIFGVPLKDTGFNQWSTIGANQPDNAKGNENCGSMHNNGLLNDINCSAENPFICEFTPRKIKC